MMKRLLSLILFVVLVAACSNAEPTAVAVEPTQPPAATHSPIPEATQTAEPTPTPTQVEPTPTEAEPTPTPELAVVWSDDFEDGNADGWEWSYGTADFSVREGALNFGPGEGGDIKHKSETTIGTWSFDAYMPEQTGWSLYIGMCANERSNRFFGLQIKRGTDTFVKLAFEEYLGDEKITFDGPWHAGEVLTGWHHFDVTRDNSNKTRVYLNVEQILESDIGEFFTTSFFVLGAPPQGPAFDNVVVWNQVIDIQPGE